MSKIQSESKSQRIWSNVNKIGCCKPICQRYNLKANHNTNINNVATILAVNQYVKDTIWKQITTLMLAVCLFQSCKPICQRYNLKANHNNRRWRGDCRTAVNQYVKDTIWKQITTHSRSIIIQQGCKPICQRYNLKANHNVQQLKY